ncbi:hypothetical protein [Ochrobactrum chromiisoli]|uniref:DUF2570 domain-containing protein n=1 Tax=Ochrobactrum chromiisoli TaxID=2993941 RepID=A0ABT3QKX5_9HYPH|nr:hypothetical protein [Ochrobactrum chromiisoli]MCX2696256.1 hypothetical protein [Ochrobactrum chromiisoli]
MPFLSNIRIIVGLLIAAILIAGWLYILHLKSQLSESDAQLALANAQLKFTVDVANANAEAVKQADAEHKRTLDLLNDVTTSLNETAIINRELEREIASTTPENDGSVAPVLENLRKRKFAGGVQ